MNSCIWRKLFSVLVAAAIVTGCSEHEVTGLGTTAPKKSRAVQEICYDTSDCPDTTTGGGTISSDPFFFAWAEDFSTYPIRTQWSGLDSRFDRVATGFAADASVLAFASANPGKLYINGDEPDAEACYTPSDYAAIYHDYVAAIRAVDPTARFSPGGFSDPADWCFGEPNRTSMHWVSYAQQFYDSYVARYGVAPPVDEWNFHSFAQWLGPADVGTVWWGQIEDAANWSTQHGAPMTLGSWGFIGGAFLLSANYTMTDYLATLRQAMDSLRSDPRIIQAVWWSYDNTGPAHYLRESDGSLTAEGLTYANLTPRDLSINVSAGYMTGVWTNTSAANAIEIQFFTYNGSSWNPTSGPMWQAPSTSSAGYPFPSGARVRFWARYVTSAGAGPWSDYSPTVTIP
jgi:hypothetical protein